MTALPDWMRGKLREAPTVEEAAARAEAYEEAVRILHANAEALRVIGCAVEYELSPRGWRMTVTDRSGESRTIGCDLSQLLLLDGFDPHLN